MRIISGIRRGKRLLSTKTTLIRPTTDRTKEFIFNFLGTNIINSKVLDLFAGTGNLGIEALSREANKAVFVENHRPNSIIIRKNLKLSQLESQAQIVTTDVFRYLKWLHKKDIRFNFIFADPPYQKKLYQRLLHEVDALNIFEKDGMFIFEYQSTENNEIELAFLRLIKFKVFGNTSISIYSRNGS